METWLIFTQIMQQLHQIPLWTSAKHRSNFQRSWTASALACGICCPSSSGGGTRWLSGDGGETAARAGGSYWAVLGGKGRHVCHAHSSSSHLKVKPVFDGQKLLVF